MPTFALANRHRGGFATRPWPPTLALTRLARYRSALGPDPFFITSCGLNKTIVILSEAEESPGRYAPTPVNNQRPFGFAQSLPRT